MIEEIIGNHLKDSLSEPVCFEIPAGMDSKTFVVVEKTGSGDGDAVTPATIAVQSYGSSLFEAAQLNERVKAAVKTLLAKNEITRVELNTDYNFTDTAEKRYRYQAVFDVYHY